MTKVTLTLNENLFQQLQDAALQNEGNVEPFLRVLYGSAR